MIIGLAGYAQSGKSTIAKILVEEHGFEHVAFADGIRRSVLALNPVIPNGKTGGWDRLQDLVSKHGWDYVKVNFSEARRLLQVFGTEVGRELFDEDIWVQELFKVIGYSGPNNYVVSDVRFPNEVGAIRAAGGVVWRVVRPHVGKVNDHVSETALDDLTFEKIILNNSGMSSLYSQARALVEELNAQTQ
jgi:hypothetical protein